MSDYEIVKAKLLELGFGGDEDDVGGVTAVWKKSCGDSTVWVLYGPMKPDPKPEERYYSLHFEHPGDLDERPVTDQPIFENCFSVKVPEKDFNVEGLDLLIQTFRLMNQQVRAVVGLVSNPTKFELGL